MIKDGVKFYVSKETLKKNNYQIYFVTQGPQVQEESTKQSKMIFKSGNVYLHGERTIRALIIGTEFAALWEAASFALWQNLLLSISNNVVSRGSLGIGWKNTLFLHHTALIFYLASGKGVIFKVMKSNIITENQNKKKTFKAWRKNIALLYGGFSRGQIKLQLYLQVYPE